MYILEPVSNRTFVHFRTFLGLKSGIDLFRETVPLMVYIVVYTDRKSSS